MHVRLPNEGNEHVDVGELNHSSSNALLTISEVTTVKAVETLMIGSPSTMSTRNGRRPQRAKDEMTAPMDSLCILASSRAASTTSLSISKVVRTSRCQCISMRTTLFLIGRGCRSWYTVGMVPDEVARSAGLVPQWARRRIAIEPLAGGITNRNFVAVVDGTRYVLRVPGERTELLGIDRAGEQQAARRAAELGIGPPIVGDLPTIGTLITELVPGHHLTGDGFIARLDGVVSHIRRLHDSGPLDSSFAIHRIVEAHGRDGALYGVTVPPIFSELVEQSHRIEAAFATAPQPLVACHNDLLPANVLFADERVWLLDYEYAGMNERFFDLGNLSVNAGLDDAADERLLRLYLGRQPNESAWARLQLMKIMSEFREGMWAVVQQAISTLDTDFVTYAEERLGNCERLVGATEYESWLLAATDPVQSWSDNDDDNES